MPQLGLVLELSASPFNFYTICVEVVSVTSAVTSAHVEQKYFKCRNSPKPIELFTIP